MGVLLCVFFNFVCLFGCLFVLLCCAGDHQKFRTVSPKHTEEREREREREREALGKQARE